MGREKKKNGKGSKKNETNPKPKAHESLKKRGYFKK
jgi:hypothetical protein